MMVDDSIPK